MLRGKYIKIVPTPADGQGKSSMGVASFGTQIFLVCEDGTEIQVPGVTRARVEFNLDTTVVAKLDVIAIGLPEEGIFADLEEITKENLIPESE